MDQELYKCQVLKATSTESFFLKPCDSKVIDIFYIRKSVTSSDCHIFAEKDLLYKAMSIPYKSGYVVVPLVTDNEMEII